MKLQGITIRGFRGIGRLDLNLDKEMTVLIGRNGVGKLSILDAIAPILNVVQQAWPTEMSSSNYSEARIELRDRQIGQDDALIEARFAMDATYPELANSNVLKISTTYKQTINRTLHERFNRFWTFVNSGGLASEKRPLMVYYRQDRGFEAKGYRSSVGGAQQALENSLEGDLQAISHLEAWWDKRDADEARHVRDKNGEYRDPQLEAIRSLIKEIDGFEGISFSSSASPEGLYFHKAKGVSVHVSMLSSGERSFIILLADLARRLQVLNPTLSLSDCPGIVLIDEIELNLHPAWQSKILSTLQRVFGNCQFIVTTHSPQVVSSIQSDHVVAMTSDESGNIRLAKPLRTKGQTSNYLLEGVFGSSERFPEIDDMIEKFNIAIDQGLFDKASKLYVDITRSIEGDPPEILVLKKRLARLKVQI